MHIYFSGIGGAGIGPLALIAKQAGFSVSGSDKQDSSYIQTLTAKGITDIHIGQDEDSIAAVHKKNPIDWIVYSSAIPKENPNHPELRFAINNHIRHSKRDEFLSELLKKTNQKMIAVAGTHGKTTTTAMFIWLFKELGLPVSYSVGAKLSFGGLGTFNPDATYFVYEADEYDRNFLSFYPEIAAIPGIDYDHPDIYPTRDDYYRAFRKFISQSNQTVLWQSDVERISLPQSSDVLVLPSNTEVGSIQLAGRVNRINAYLAVQTMVSLGLCDEQTGIEIMGRFPGVSRRFEKIAENIYTDYAHTPEKIRGALQLTEEIAPARVVVVYEGLHNTRQHFIKDELPTLFKGVKKLYVVPSYLAREDESLELLTPEKLCEIIQEPHDRQPMQLSEDLAAAIKGHVEQGDLVLCLTAGGGHSLDEWLRENFKNK